MKYLIYSAIAVVMILFIMFISIVFFFGCSPAPKTLQHTEITPRNIDSLSSLTSQSIEQHSSNKITTALDLDSIANCLHQTEQTMNKQKQELLRHIVELNVIKRELLLELNNYRTGKTITKDTILYNTKYKDTTIVKQITVYDTIYKRLLIKNRKQ